MQRFFANAGAQSGLVSFDRREADRLGSGRWRGLDVKTQMASVSAFFEKYGQINPEISQDGCQAASIYGTITSTVRGVDALPGWTATSDAEINRYVTIGLPCIAPTEASRLFS